MKAERCLTCSSSTLSRATDIESNTASFDTAAETKSDLIQIRRPIRKFRSCEQIDLVVSTVGQTYMYNFILLFETVMVFRVL